MFNALSSFGKVETNIENFWDWGIHNRGFELNPALQILFRGCLLMLFAIASPARSADTVH